MKLVCFFVYLLAISIIFLSSCSKEEPPPEREDSPVKEENIGKPPVDEIAVKGLAVIEAGYDDEKYGEGEEEEREREREREREFVRAIIS